jgi:hypothetical protein
MQQLVRVGLIKTERDAAAKEAVSNGFQIFNTVKSGVEMAIKACPEASVAWVPVCFALDVQSAKVKGRRTQLT